MFLSQIKFSEYIGVHKATVSKMKKRRELVFHNKKIDAEKTIELLKTLGKTFTSENKMITSNTTPTSAPTAPDTNLLNTTFDYPTLTAEEKIKQEKQLLEKEMEQQAKELGLSLEDIQTPEIASMEKWEVERFKIFYQGMLERAKYFKEIGKLVDIETVEEEHFRISRTVREAVLGMSNRIAHKLINNRNLHDIKNIIDHEAMNVLENLST